MSKILLLCLYACVVLTSATYSRYQQYNNFLPGYYRDIIPYQTGYPTGYPGMNTYGGHRRYRRSVYSYPNYKRYGGKRFGGRRFGGRGQGRWVQSGFGQQFRGGAWNNGRFNRQNTNMQFW